MPRLYFPTVKTTRETKHIAISILLFIFSATLRSTNVGVAIYQPFPQLGNFEKCVLYLWISKSLFGENMTQKLSQLTLLNRRCKLLYLNALPGIQKNRQKSGVLQSLNKLYVKFILKIYWELVLIFISSFISATTKSKFFK